MKKVFISYSFTKRKDFEELHNRLKSFLEEKYNFEIYAFVFDYKDNVNDKKLMEEAFRNIDESDLVMVELSNMSVGVGIEAGYAKAKGKPIVYLHKKGTRLKEAMNGIVDKVFTYENTEDLIKQISTLKLLQG